MRNVRHCCGWSALHQALTWHCSKETSCHTSSAFSIQGVKVPGSCFPKPKSQSFLSNILQHFSFPTLGTVLLCCTHSVEITEMILRLRAQPGSSSSPCEAHCRAILKPQFQCAHMINAVHDDALSNTSSSIFQIPVRLVRFPNRGHILNMPRRMVFHVSKGELFKKEKQSTLT